MNILKRDLFIDFEKSKFNDSKVSYTTFTRVWKTDFTHLKIPTIIRLGVCDICLFIKTVTSRYHRASKDSKTTSTSSSRHSFGKRQISY